VLRKLHGFSYAVFAWDKLGLKKQGAISCALFSGYTLVRSVR